MEDSSTVRQLNALCKNTLSDTLGMEFLSAEKGKVVAKMPVDSRTIQPFKILHGGASLALAETVASVGSTMLVDLSKFGVVGVEVNGNHVGRVTSGFVTATATIVHQGGKTHVWNVDIVDENSRLVMVGRVTIMVIENNR